MTDFLQGSWEAFLALPHLRTWLTAAWVVYILGLCVWIILQKREPAATLSWVISLALLPYVGFLIYFMLGPQKIRRQRLRRGRSRTRMKEYNRAGQPIAIGDDLARLAQSTTGLPPSTATRLDWLIDGCNTYTAILEAVATARHHVHLEYYIFNPDQTGTRLRDALVERARAGVKVRLLLDAVGSAGTRNRFLQPLVDAGGEIAWFHPTRLRPFKRPWVNLRCHRKIVVVDGRIAFTGGINITDDQNERIAPSAYRDLHMRLEGEVVRSIQLVFVEDWVYATGQDPHDFSQSALWQVDEPLPSPGPIPAQTLISGPDSSWETIHRLHVAAINEAKHRVWLVTPYFVPGEAARMALTSAALRGLDVCVVVPKMSDSRLVTYAARSYFGELLKAGVNVYEYGPRMLHTKALLADEALCIVGSANFDHRSFRLNFEISMLIRDRAAVARLGALIEHERASSVRVEDKRNRGLWRHRLPEAFARLTSPLL